MWEKLWQEFDALARAYAPGRAPKMEGAVARTIRWQRQGHRDFVGRKISAMDLQLPELYSGAPWRHGRKRWIAFVTINPSIDVNEIFPTRANLRKFGCASLEDVFSNRFTPGPSKTPIKHGRDGKGRAKWVRGRRDATYQRTWAEIDRALRDCLLDMTVDERDAPLGRIATIVDVVPWKFKAWSKVGPDIRDELLELGAPYLRGVLKAYPPAIIIAAGHAVRVLMESRYQGVPKYAPGNPQRGRLHIGKLRVPWFGVSHPAAHADRFHSDMMLISPSICKHLRG